MKVYSLFSGIGGIERGLAASGHEAVGFVESDPFAQIVLRKRFPDVSLKSDVQKLTSLPKCDVLTAGWPCQDISQAGSTLGLDGIKSSLVDEVFRLVAAAKSKPQYIVLENVAFVLHLKGGLVLRHVVSQLEALGYRWAYRILDTQYFGLPQRRRRAFIVASLDTDPRTVLLSNRRVELQLPVAKRNTPCGFYWTEGNTGIGWAVDAVPPLKGGSTIAIPSPPAIWLPSRGKFCLPSIEAAERLQGFPAGWTSPAREVASRGDRERWRLVGNAVSVPVAAWLGTRLSNPLSTYRENNDQEIATNAKWPKAGWGVNGKRYAADCDDEGVGVRQHSSITDYLDDAQALSKRAATGLASRLEKGFLKISDEFLSQLCEYAA